MEESAITLPGRIPHFKSEDVKILSSSETKVAVWQVHQSACELSGKLVQLWQQFFPNAIVPKPMTNLCLTCQENTAKLQHAANLSASEKSELIKTQQEHLNCAQGERDFYKYSCTACEGTLKTFGTDTHLNLESRQTGSLDGIIHYSFDYAQQGHILSNPMQPGSMYFKTLMCEGIPRQVKFLIDKAASARKGANMTISYVPYFFENQGLGEMDAHLHADNCAGKTKTIIFYGIWHGELDAPSAITYSFLNTGHTKFGPDRSFGVIKKAFKVIYVSSLYEFACLVKTSGSSGVNIAQLEGTHNGRVVVPVYDWASFLGQYFKKMPNIKKFHHFRFSKESWNGLL